jgi:hypothetical protein
MLKIGTLGLGGLNLSSLLEARARAAEAGVALKNRSVVLLFLEGGAPHVETFDPKMSAPAEFRSMSGEVQTSIPGVTLGATFPEMARVAHRMAFVRSFHHGDSEHLSASKLMSSGEKPDRWLHGIPVCSAGGNFKSHDRDAKQRGGQTGFGGGSV